MIIRIDFFLKILSINRNFLILILKKLLLLFDNVTDTKVNECEGFYAKNNWTF